MTLRYRDSSPDTAVRTQGLAKDYGPIHAVAGLDLDVRRGEIYAFRGPNGAGKTTTIRMLLGLVRPTSSAVAILGERVTWAVTVPGTPSARTCT